MAHQLPAASNRLQAIEAPAEFGHMQFAQTFEERPLFLQATKIDLKTILPQRPRNFYELTLRATRLQAVDHEKDGARGTGRRKRTGCLRGCRVIRFRPGSVVFQ